MKTNKKHATRNKNINRIVIATALILLIPAAAMQFSDQVAWGPMDFVIAGALLLGTGLSFELLVKKLAAQGIKHLLASRFWLCCF